MDFSNIRLFSLLKTKMEYTSERQDLLSQNIANIDTPGFHPEDLKKLDFNRLAMTESNRLAMRVTSPSHMMSKVAAPSFRTEEQRKAYETTPVDNKVVLEEQMMKLASNSNDHAVASRIYSKMGDMFKLVTGHKQ